jgi:two-component system nitrogen regulation response regulator GlnG
MAFCSAVGAEPRFIDSTLQPPGRSGRAPPHDPVIVLAHHPVLARVGEVLPLGRVTEVSRLAPSLVGEDGRDTGPIDDPFVSRQPFAVRRLGDGGVEIASSGVGVAVAGAALPAGGVHRIAAGELARGVPIVLAGRVVLWLTTDHDRRGRGELGLLGCSAAMRALRAAVRDAAALHGPILIRGETGTGKELVARALHAAGPRAAGPYVGVNVAAIPAAVAAAELFGHERGAFTGALDRRAGYFERAHGGVVFLDEIGELADAIQPVVLRALESGEIQPVGGAPRAVDAVVVAATDVDLEAAVRAGRFRAPLYHRLAATVVDVPPLRERGADAALLLAHFLCDALPAELTDRTADPSPWLPAAVVAALLRAPWPGNVRQLRNIAQRLARIARAGQVATLDQLGLEIDDLELAEAEPDAVAASGEAGADGRRTTIGEDDLVAALRAHGFQLSRTAAALGISRSHLDALIARSPRVRKANRLSRDEIAACLAELGGDIDAAAARLEVSPRGLRLRMKQLGW